MKLKPAEYVIMAFGGVTACARAIGMNKSSVHKWKKSKENRGCDGMIPTANQVKVLEAAKLLGIDVTPTDLVLGREVAEE